MARKRKHDDETPPADGAEETAVVPDDAPDDFAGAAAGDEPGPDDDVRVTRAAHAADGTKSDAKPPPPFGTQRPAGPGALPRVISELERAGRGETRFKIACRNYSPQKTRYVLAGAGDEAGAIDCYLRANGLAAHLKKLRGRLKKGEELEQPELVVTELPD
jgi:hypothetical protein